MTTLLAQQAAINAARRGDHASVGIFLDIIRDVLIASSYPEPAPPPARIAQTPYEQAVMRTLR